MATVRVSDAQLSSMIAATAIEIDKGSREMRLWAETVAQILVELHDRRAAEREQAAPQAEGRVIRLRKRPRWLRDLLDVWERRACDLVAQGRAFDAEDLRAGAEEVRKAHDGRSRNPAKWERKLREMGGVLYAPATAPKEFAGQWMVYVSLGTMEEHRFYADTAKAAVKAAFKSWKESR